MRKNVLKLGIILSTVALIFCNDKKQQTAAEKENAPSELTDIDRGKAILQSLVSQDSTALDYISDSQYIQHNVYVPDGKQAFRDFRKSIMNMGVNIDIVRAFQDNDVVVLQAVYDAGDKKTVGFDLFRFKDGKAVEHWDNAQALRETVSGHMMYDGEAVVTDLDKTEANKALVKTFVTDFLVNGDTSAIDKYINSDKYIQHNPDIGDGISGLKTALAAMKEKGIKLAYDKIHHVLGQGNFVLVVSESNSMGKPLSIYDLFRVENGKISEHWDIIEEIPAKDKWANPHGKF